MHEPQLCGLTTPGLCYREQGALPYRPAAGQTAEWRQPGYEPAWHAVLSTLKRK
jgi:hypothetical protein